MEGLLCFACTIKVGLGNEGYHYKKVFDNF